MIKWKKLVLGLVLVLMIASVLSLGYEWLRWGCPDDPYARYYTDSPCFDIDFRCHTECRRYNLNFTGEIDACDCHCGDDKMVSICTGLLHSNEEVNDV